MRRKITFSLSTESINNALRELGEYKEELRYKNSIFVQRLAEAGLKVIEANKYSEGDADFSSLHSYVWIDEGETTTKATLVLTGKDVAFIEFGAGVHYNGSGGSSPHPQGQRLGLTIGSYGKGHGLEDSWVYYDSEQARYKTTHGTKAVMPLAKADEDIRKRYLEIAKEVFG